MKSLISKNLLYLSVGATLQHALERMSHCGVSSALVEDAGEVCGILTERDVVRKFCLSKTSWHASRVETLMSAPVEFARLDRLIEDITELHCRKSLRHFPVAHTSSSPRIENVVGMITVTDICRKYLDSLREEWDSFQFAKVRNDQIQSIFAHIS